MKRYKRDYVRLDGTLNFYKMNLYKHENGLVYINYEGYWQEVKKYPNNYYWTLVVEND